MSQVYLGRGRSRKALSLGKLLGEGAAGKVHALPEMPGSAAKIYHGAAAGKHEAKIDAMLANPPDLPPAEHDRLHYPQIAWPQDKLFDGAGRFIGFLMPEIDFRRSTSLVNLLQKNSRRIEKLSEYYGYRVLVARNIASVFAELHKAGHHMIDMKPANLRFYPSMSWMAVVDTDGFSILGKNGRIAADQLSDEYIAPESWKREPGELGVEQDLFALAVIIFQLLNNGVHPYSGAAGKGTFATDLQSRILAGLYAYGLASAADAEPSLASIHRMFRRGTRVMFDCAFLDNGRRPSAEEWRDHLDFLMSQLAPCSAKPDEHVHFGAGCGFCGHEARIAAARTKPAKRPRPRHDPVPRRRAVQHTVQSSTMPTPGRRRPQPRPMPARVLVATPRPPRQRNGAWAGLFAVLMIGTAVIGMQELWQPLLARGDIVRAPSVTSLPTVSVADVASFAEPREFRVMPAAGELWVPLREGPGDEFPEVERLTLHEAVIGSGTSPSVEGRPWVQVTRDDGATGFVDQSALLTRGVATREGSSGTPSLALSSDNIDFRIERRYRALVLEADGYDRAWLTEGQRLWEAERRRCVDSLAPPVCVHALNEQRLSELESWSTADHRQADSNPPPGSLTGASFGTWR